MFQPWGGGRGRSRRSPPRCLESPAPPQKKGEKGGCGVAIWGCVGLILMGGQRRAPCPYGEVTVPILTGGAQCRSPLPNWWERGGGAGSPVPNRDQRGVPVAGWVLRGGVLHALSPPVSPSRRVPVPTSVSVPTSVPSGVPTGVPTGVPVPLVGSGSSRRSAPLPHAGPKMSPPASVGPPTVSPAPQQRGDGSSGPALHPGQLGGASLIAAIRISSLSHFCSVAATRRRARDAVCVPVP